MKNRITIQDKILYLLLPFVIGCSTATATTPKTKSWGQVSGYSQLDYTEPAIEPNWLRKPPQTNDAYFFVGMSNKRSERKDAKNESFNDAMIAFARFCGLNVSVMEEHKDISIGGNGGVIDTLTRGNTFAKLRADMFMGNVTVEDRYLERYSNFHGGSFMGHSFVVSTLIKVPQDEMETCRENRKTANAYMEEQSETIAKLSKKNTSLENRLQQVERNNQTLAMNQVMQSNKLFEQVKKKPVVEEIVKKPVIVTETAIVKKPAIIKKPAIVKKSVSVKEIIKKYNLNNSEVEYDPYGVVVIKPDLHVKNNSVSKTSISEICDYCIINFNGGTYKGQISNGLPHGEGTLTFKDGSLNSGEWLDGKQWNVKQFNTDGTSVVEWIQGKITLSNYVSLNN